MITEGLPLIETLLYIFQVTYPNMIEYFEQAGVEMEESEMSFSVSLEGGRGCEWGSSSISGLFAQKRNALDPYFYQMIYEITKFKDDVLRYDPLITHSKVSLTSGSIFDYIWKEFMRKFAQ